MSNGDKGSNLQLFMALMVLAAIALGGWHLFQPSKSEVDFTLRDLDGADFSLSDFRGRVVLLDFMATWCGPCQASMPDLLAMHEDMGDRMVLISISIDPVHDTDEVLESWRSGWGAEWIHARDLSDPPVSQMFEVASIPTYFIVDRRGVVKYKHVGLTPDSVLRQELLELINR